MTFKYNLGQEVVHETVRGRGTIESRQEHVDQGVLYLVAYWAHDAGGNRVSQSATRNWWPEAQLQLAS